MPGRQGGISGGDFQITTRCGDGITSVTDAQTVTLVERIRNYAMPEGAIQCRGTWLRQAGEMRFAPGKPWMPFHAEQWFSGDGLDFRWKAWVRMNVMIRARVVDSFQNGRGTLTADVFGFVPVARSRGPATDKGEAMRGLAELPWRPFAFGGASWLAWESAGDGKLRAAFDDAHTRAAVEFAVDARGEVQSVYAPDRPRIIGATVIETPWSGVFSEYRMFNGVRVPTAAEVSWSLPEGPFTYWRGRITEVGVHR
jgi:hypothetical protein